MLRSRETYKKVTIMFVSFKNSIHLIKLDIFALEEFYEDSIKPPNKNEHVC